jgi:hypothetical protein
VASFEVIAPKMDSSSSTTSGSIGPTMPGFGIEK